MAILGNQGYRRDLNLGETESEIEVINNLGGAGIAADLRLIQNNLRNTSKIGFCTITDGFFNTGISTVIQLSELSKTIDESDSDLIDFTVTLDPPQYIEEAHQVEIRGIVKSSEDNSQSILNGFYYVNQVINDGQKYKFILPEGFKLGSENPVIVNDATDGFSTVRISPRDTFTFTKDDVVGLSSDVTFQIQDPGEPGFTTTLTKGRDYYVCNSDGLSKFKLSYFPSGYSSDAQVGIQTINVVGIDYTSSSTQFFNFIRKDIVTQENLINFIKPDEGVGGDDEDAGFRFFRTSDDPEAYGTLNEVFDESSNILDNTRFQLRSRYEKTKSISSTKDIKYEGSVIIKDPDGFNGGSTQLGFPASPGIFIAGTRAFSADNNPWTDEDEIVNPGTGIQNALVTKSFQVGVNEIVFHDQTVSDPSTSINDIKIDGLGSNDIKTLTGINAGNYTHKIPVVVNGETYFLLVVAN